MKNELLPQRWIGFAAFRKTSQLFENMSSNHFHDLQVSKASFEIFISVHVFYVFHDAADAVAALDID